MQRLRIGIHENLRRTACIRAFLDYLAEALAKEAPLSEGLSHKTDPPCQGDPLNVDEHVSPARKTDGN